MSTSTPPPPLTGHTTIASFFLTNPNGQPPTLNPAYFGFSGGFGYPPVAFSATVTSKTGTGAVLLANVDNGEVAIPPATLPGSVTSVDVIYGGSGYLLGNLVDFSGASRGSGASAVVTGIDSSGAVTSVALSPNGIVNQLLFSITGASNPPVYYTSGGSTFAANGVVGAFSTEVSGYYANASALETNLEDLTQALNLISATSSDYAGQSTAMGIPANRSALVWYTSSTNGSYTSTTLDSSITIFNFLKNYASITLNTALGGTSEQQVNIQAINAGIAPVQNTLQTQQAFLNSAVSTLQTQISQFSQVINQYFSAMQGAANAIG